MKNIIIFIGIFLLISNSTKSQTTISVHLRNVDGFVEVVTEYIKVIVPNDTSYTVNDTVIELSDKTISNKGKKQVCSIYKIHIYKKSINFVKTFLIREVQNNYIIINFTEEEKAIKDELEYKENPGPSANIELVDRAINLINSLKEKADYYNKRLLGKSESEIADILYDEGFSKSYSKEGAVSYTIYSARWSFNNGDYYLIKMYFWYSKIVDKILSKGKFDAFLNEFGYIIYDGKETELFKNYFK